MTRTTICRPPPRVPSTIGSSTEIQTWRRVLLAAMKMEGRFREHLQFRLVVPDPEFKISVWTFPPQYADPADWLPFPYTCDYFTRTSKPLGRVILKVCLRRWSTSWPRDWNTRRSAGTRVDDAWDAVASFKAKWNRFLPFIDLLLDPMYL